MSRVIESRVVVDSRERPLRIMGVASLYLPWLLAEAAASYSMTSWIVAWLGSGWIFLVVWSGAAGRLTRGVSWNRILLRPIYLVHAIFALYGFVSSIFYVLDLNGIAPGAAIAEAAGEDHFTLVAQAQRYYVLAHASLAAGLLIAYRSGRRARWRFRLGGHPVEFLLVLAAVALLGSYGLGFVPPLQQFSEKLAQLAMVAGATSLGPALQRGGGRWLPISLAVLGVLFLYALASGWKSESLVLLMLASVALAPKYPKAALSLFGCGVLAGILVLPIVTQTIRETNWKGRTDQWTALKLAAADLQEKSAEEVTETSWRFLTGRASEVQMFTKYIDGVESTGSRPGLTILKQSAMALIPRALWPGKPNMELLVSERVYRYGVVGQAGTVSAKPHPTADGFLVAGGLGVALSSLLLGLIASWASSWSESYLGGYFLGGIFFNGLFGILWTGNCFEFMANAIVWSMILIGIIFIGCQMANFLTPVPRATGRSVRVRPAATP